MAEITMETVKLCESIAREAHEGQTRKLGEDKGKPYIIHPERMAAAALRHDQLDVAAVCWLHDVVEDCDVTLDDLRERGVPADVVTAVDHVTQRSGEEYITYIMRARQHPVAAQVKLLDLDDNLKSIHPGSMRDKYMLARQIIIAAMTRRRQLTSKT
jgi:(p)ppGpp synthase/HD superfamily hydrolase